MSNVSNDVAEQYQHYYDNYDPEEWRLGAIDKVDNIASLCAGLGVRSILDIGCGEGSIISRLSEIGFGERYTGLDLSQQAIAAAQRRSIPRANFQPFNGAEIDFEDKTFDLAILTHVVEHLEHPRTLIREAQRAARHVVIEVPCEHTLRMRNDYEATATGHINFYTPSTIRRLVQTCGLKVDRQITRDCSLDSMQLYGRYKGTLQYIARRAALVLVPRIAPRVFVYHSALLCR